MWSQRGVHVSFHIPLSAAFKVWLEGLLGRMGISRTSDYTSDHNSESMQLPKRRPPKESDAAFMLWVSSK